MKRSLPPAFTDALPRARCQNLTTANGRIICPRHEPELYADIAAKHRNDRP